jgi:hypothetical protein
MRRVLVGDLFVSFVANNYFDADVITLGRVTRDSVIHPKPIRD